MSRKFVRVSTAAFLASCLFLAFAFHYSRQAAWPRPLGQPSTTSDPVDSTENSSSVYSNASCAPDLDILRSFDLGKEIDYARIDISVLRTENSDGLSKDLNIPFPDLNRLSLHEGNSPEDASQECTSITLEMPPSEPPTDASHILFGVATTGERLNESLDAFAHWAGNTNTSIIAVLESDPEMSKLNLPEKAKGMGISLTIIESDEHYLDRYFSLVRVLYKHRDETTQWAGIIDDDTFFPSMSNLVARLSKYDANEPQYIGGVSEDSHQLPAWGYIAYGGAGIFLSMPLVQQLDAVYEECNAVKQTGDLRIAKCIYHHTTTKLTWEHGLHQLDLRHDLSGFFECDRPLPLSFHHWKSWFDVNMVPLSAVSSVCDDTCMLHRMNFTDGWLLVNGYSIIKYSTPQDDASRMERTWHGTPGDEDRFMHALGPFRPKDEGKLSYRLIDAIEEPGRVRQFYMREPSFTKTKRVVEIVWKSL